MTVRPNGFVRSQTSGSDHRVSKVIASARRHGTLGLALSNGPFVLFLDDDDLLIQGALERLIRAVTRRRATAAVGASRRFAENGMSRRQIVPPASALDGRGLA